MVAPVEDRDANLAVALDESNSTATTTELELVVARIIRPTLSSTVPPKVSAVSRATIVALPVMLSKAY